MRVADIIESLKRYDPEDSVVVAWWDRESFDPDLVSELSLDEWGSICESLDDKDWSFTSDQLDVDLREILREEGEVQDGSFCR